jgi:hypothetical protein
MCADDYAASFQDVVAEEAIVEQVPDSPWDPQLAAVMRDKRIAAYEESLLPLLLNDLQRGAPPLVGS